MKTKQNVSFPGESKEYREAREKLLEEEINLRRHTEEVAGLRRKLPKGGSLKEDYVLEELDRKTGKTKEIKFSELFAEGKNTLIIYNFMYAPANENACPSCSSIIDGLNGMIYHAEQLVNFAVIAKAPMDKLMKWADKRGWNKIRLLSSFKNSFNTDYYAELPNGSQLPMLNVFRKTDEGIFHFYSSEMVYAPPDEGQNERQVDMIWPLWNLLDITPEGRGTDWHPKNSY
jgi:predicted dithiol-disulfide oxidoreductase (DUF899 family)